MNQATVVEVDYIGYVRENIRSMSGSERVRLAADANLSPRTLEHVAKGERDAKYSTVLGLYKLLRENEAKAEAGAKR